MSGTDLVMKYFKAILCLLLIHEFSFVVTGERNAYFVLVMSLGGLPMDITARIAD